jgi:predicted amidohydrolase YtcJ
MRSASRHTLCAVLGFLLLTGISCSVRRWPPHNVADLVVRGAQIYRVAPVRSWAEALAVREGRLIYVGTDSGVASFIGPHTKVLDLPGRMVLPGFHDNHVHPLAAGLELGECNLYDVKTPEEAERIIRDYIAAHPDTGWLRGNGWQLPLFPEANPNKAVLDRIVPDRPAFFWAADGHSAWLNSKALAVAGIKRDTKDPPGGRIERDATGEPSGTLRESAVDLATAVLPGYTMGQEVEAAKRAIAEANRVGIVALSEANADPDYLQAYAELERRGELTAEIVAAVSSHAESPDAEVRRLQTLKEQLESPHLQIGTMKIFADGVIEAKTAALLAPYLDRPGDRGSLNYQPDSLNALVAALDRAGFQVHVHAIGDGAIRETLDAFENAATQNGFHDARHIIAHLELIDSTDIPRFRELGVVASFQAFWAQPDEYITELTEPALGKARSRWLYPIGSVMNSGAVVVGGSDWSVSSLNPLDAIEVAITRHTTDSTGGPSWIPEERVDLERMLAAYTINGAFANHQERERGSLEVGKSADFIVLDRNLFEVPSNQIHTVKVLRTFFEGREVFSSDSKE